MGNPTERGVWQAIVHGVTKSRRDLVTKPPLPPPKEDDLSQLHVERTELGSQRKLRAFSVQMTFLMLPLWS